MPQSRLPRLMALTLFSFTLVCQASHAQDGPIRQWFKERALAKQQEALATPITEPGDYTFVIQHDDLQRKYRVHVPKSYATAKPAALLLALHGGGGNMDFQANDRNYGLISKSEAEGFVAVFPNGYSKRSSGRFATWNAGNCCGAARDNSVDDVGFIRQVIVNVSAQMNIDPNRIFATGMSNGAMMAYRLACEASDVITGIAAVAGTDNTTHCEPSRPVPILHIHAKNDSHVRFVGGAGPNAVDVDLVTEFTSVPHTISTWVELNRCEATPQRVLENNGATCERFAPCAGDSAVQLCITETGDHSWPGGEKPRAAEPPSQAISANDVMWDFFNQQ